MKKRLLSTVLVFTMALAMTACGSKDGKAGNKVTVTMDELQTKMTEAIKTVDSVDFDLDVKLGVDMEASGESMDMEADFNAEGQATVDTPAAHVKFSGNMKYGTETDSMDNKTKGEAYVLTEDENMSLYYNMDDEGWYKGTATTDDIMGEVESALSMYGMDMESVLSSATTEDAAETLAPVLSEKTVEAEGKECYELVLKVDKEFVEKELAAAETELDDDVKAEVDEAMKGFKTLDGAIKIYVDVDSNLPVKVVYGLKLEMDIEMYDETMKLNMDEFDITLTADYNEVKAIEVPSDVKENAVDLAE